MSKQFIILSILPFMLGINVNATQSTLPISDNTEQRLINLEANVVQINNNIKNLQDNYHALAHKQDMQFNKLEQNQQRQSIQLSNMAQKQERHFARLNTIESNKQLSNYSFEDKMDNAINNHFTATENCINKLNNLSTIEEKMQYIEQCGLQNIPGIKEVITNNKSFDPNITTQIQNTIAQQLSNSNPEELQQTMSNYGLISNNTPQENNYTNTPDESSTNISTITNNPYSMDNTNKVLNTSNISQVTNDNAPPAPVISTSYDTILEQLNNATVQDIAQISQQSPELQEIVENYKKTYPDQPLNISTIQQEFASRINNNQNNDTPHLSDENNLNSTNMLSTSTPTVPNESFITDSNNISPQQREQILNNNSALLQSMSEDERQNLIQQGILPENKTEISEQLAGALEQQTIQNNMDNIISNLQSAETAEQRKGLLNQYMQQGIMPQMSQEDINNYLNNGLLHTNEEFYIALKDNIANNIVNNNLNNEVNNIIKSLRNIAPENRESIIKQYIENGTLPQMNEEQINHYINAGELPNSPEFIQQLQNNIANSITHDNVANIINELQNAQNSNEREQLLQKYGDVLQFMTPEEQNSYVSNGNINIDDAFQQNLFNNVSQQYTNGIQQQYNLAGINDNSANILSRSQSALQASTLTNPDNSDFKLLYNSSYNINYDNISKEELVKRLIESNNALQTCEKTCKLLQSNKAINNDINSAESGVTVSNSNIINNTSAGQSILQNPNVVQTGVIQDQPQVIQADINIDVINPSYSSNSDLDSANIETTNTNVEPSNTQVIHTDNGTNIITTNPVADNNNASDESVDLEQNSVENMGTNYENDSNNMNISNIMFNPQNTDTNETDNINNKNEINDGNNLNVTVNQQDTGQENLENIQQRNITPSNIPQENAIQINSMNQQQIEEIPNTKQNQPELSTQQPIVNNIPNQIMLSNQQQIQPQNNQQITQQAQVDLSQDNTPEVIPVVNTDNIQNTNDNIDIANFTNTQQVIPNIGQQKINDNPQTISNQNIIKDNNLVTEQIDDINSTMQNVNLQQSQTNPNINPGELMVNYPQERSQNVNENNNVNTNTIVHNDNNQIKNVDDNQLEEYNAKQEGEAINVSGLDIDYNAEAEQEISNYEQNVNELDDLYNNEEEQINNGEQGNIKQYNMEQNTGEQQYIVDGEGYNINQVSEENQFENQMDGFVTPININNINQINNQLDIGNVNQMNTGKPNTSIKHPNLNQAQIYNHNTKDIKYLNLQNIAQSDGEYNTDEEELLDYNEINNNMGSEEDLYENQEGYIEEEQYSDQYNYNGKGNELGINDEMNDFVFNDNNDNNQQEVEQDDPNLYGQNIDSQIGQVLQYQNISGQDINLEYDIDMNYGGTYDTKDNTGDVNANIPLASDNNMKILSTITDASNNTNFSL